MTPILHPLGISLAVVFVLSMVFLFWWMFHVPPQVPHEVATVRRSIAALQHILVPVSSRVTSERAVELACRLGAAQKAEIILVYVIEVPFTLSLTTPLPAEEARGQEALRTARFIVEQHGLPVKARIVPHRYAWDGILHITREEQADAVVMSVGGNHPGGEVLGRTSQEVVRRAACEVILDKMALRGA